MEILGHSQISVTLKTYAHVAQISPATRLSASRQRCGVTSPNPMKAQAVYREPRYDLGLPPEPPDGIEPSTYALRVRRSDRLS
jgi:hypothetical protein